MPRGNPTSFVNTRFTAQQLADLDVALFQYNATHKSKRLTRSAFVRLAIDRCVSETLRKRAYNRERSANRNKQAVSDPLPLALSTPADERAKASATQEGPRFDVGPIVEAYLDSIEEEASKMDAE